MSTTLTLPDELAETYAEIARRDGRSVDDVVRTALEVYAERAAGRIAVNGAEAMSPPSPNGTPVASGLPPVDQPSGARRFESLGAGESTLNDGYDSTNIKDWIRKTWRPDAGRASE